MSIVVIFDDMNYMLYIFMWKHSFNHQWNMLLLVPKGVALHVVWPSACRPQPSLNDSIRHYVIMYHYNIKTWESSTCKPKVATSLHIIMHVHSHMTLQHRGYQHNLSSVDTLKIMLMRAWLENLYILQR